MRVETTPQVTGNRKSVRIHSNYILNGGLVILDAIHMPYGCGTWPAFWSSGDNWPTEGEIDILEGVNGYTQNQASLHTLAGCTIPQDYGGSGVLAAVGTNALNCAADATGNQGCGQLSSLPNNYGKAFNDNGGGVYASECQSLVVFEWCLTADVFSEMGHFWYFRVLLPSPIYPFGYYFWRAAALDMGYTVG